MNYQQYVKENLPKQVTLDEEEIQHVATCLAKLHQHIEGTLGYPLGGFLTVVAKSDFKEAFSRADSTNQAAMSVYAKFMYNYAPINF